MAATSEKLLTIALLAMLGGCVQTTSDGRRLPLEDRVEKFSKPDGYGVVCYQVTWSSRLSCVKVEAADGR
jgi:hypothetical protein